MAYGQSMADGSTWGTTDVNYDAVDSDLGSWSDWFKDIGGSAVKTALGAYTYRSVIQPAGGIPAIGQDGRVYVEGQRVAYPQQQGAGNMVPGVSNGLLLLAGAALVAVFLLKD